MLQCTTMSKKDDVKAKISFFQAFIILIVTTLFAIFGYVAIHYKEFDLVLGVGTAGAIVVLLAMLGVFVRYFVKCLKKLKDMK